MWKIFFKKQKNIILIYFQVNITLKSNYNHTLNHHVKTLNNFIYLFLYFKKNLFFIFIY
jgi:hypothetical protein